MTIDKQNELKIVKEKYFEHFAKETSINFHMMTIHELERDKARLTRGRFVLFHFKQFWFLLILFPFFDIPATIQINGLLNLEIVVGLEKLIMLLKDQLCKRFIHFKQQVGGCGCDVLDRNRN